MVISLGSARVGMQVFFLPIILLSFVYIFLSLFYFLSLIHNNRNHIWLVEIH